MNFYVIKDSSSDEDSVTMLKPEPLTVDEINMYGEGHVNMYATLNDESDYYQSAFDVHGYGGTQYYSSETCNSLQNPIISGCKINYIDSDVKYIVDLWANNEFLKNEIIEARLFSFDEVHGLGYASEAESPCGGACGILYYSVNDLVPTWIYNDNYNYWIMGTDEKIWNVRENGSISMSNSYNYENTVRPVVVIKKNSLEKTDDNIIDYIDENNKSIEENDRKEKSATVKVDNTYMNMSIIIIMLGFIIASISVFIFYKIRNKVK